jgi:hypothetical protein
MVTPIDNLISIRSSEIINQNSLQIVFAKDWYQEDVTQLITTILSFLKDHQVLENISGADRENCRFKWRSDYFILNFECYSQSCWIENETAPDIELLTLLKQNLETL